MPHHVHAQLVVELKNRRFITLDSDLALVLIYLKEGVLCAFNCNDLVIIRFNLALVNL